MSTIEYLEGSIEGIIRTINKREREVYEEMKPKLFEMRYSESHCRRVEKLQEHHNRWLAQWDEELKKKEAELKKLKQNMWVKE